MTDDRTPLASGFSEAAAVATEARARVERLLSSGALTAAETDRVAALGIRTFAGDGAASEAFRRCCIAWEIDREREIRSHRAFVGPFIVGAKRLVARIFRFQSQEALAQQREFNRSLLVVLADLVERVEGRREGSRPRS